MVLKGHECGDALAEQDGLIVEVPEDSSRAIVSDDELVLISVGDGSLVDDR